MNRKYILYNPKAGNGACKEDAELLWVIYNNTEYCDITKIEDYAEFFRNLDESDDVILCGGDGTLNRFANDTKDLAISNSIYYFATGTGNDFIRDLGLTKYADPNFRINDYFRSLPSVAIHGQKFYFLNNAGVGVDDYSLLFHYKPGNAIITVDGLSYRFKKVWLAHTMNGRYGNGMMIAPMQDRLSIDKSLSIVVMHGVGRLKALWMFPSISKGKHVRYKKHVTVLTGSEITVEFDRPTTLQIDGELISGITAYQTKQYVNRLPNGGDSSDTNKSKRKTV